MHIALTSSIARVSLLKPGMGAYHRRERVCMWSLSDVIALEVEIEGNLDSDPTKAKQKNSGALISWTI
jgi:hypothetical protein